MKKKMSLEYFDRYDQVAIVDSDIRYIKSNVWTSFIDLPAEYDFGGVVERDLPIEI